MSALGQKQTFAPQKVMSAFLPKADIPGSDQHVCFVPWVDGSGFARTVFTLQHIGRCSHVFGLLMRHSGPLAMMPSADQIPDQSTHSTMRVR
jgi:hypothetical protein